MSLELLKIPKRRADLSYNRSFDVGNSPSRFKKIDIEKFAKKRKPLIVSEETKEEFELTDGDVKLMKHHNIKN
jgi:hypothetical protein